MRDVLLTDERKGIISRVYNRLLNLTHEASALPCRRGWEKYLGPIDGDIWELCITSAPLVSDYLIYIYCIGYTELQLDYINGDLE